MNKDITIRNASRQDIPQMLDLVRELAEFEKQPDAVTASISDYSDAFDQGIYHAIVAVKNQTIVGMALYYYCFSTWKGKAMYLEDFIVKEEWRRFGLGEKIFNQFLDEAKYKGCKMVRWQVLNWNEMAINFYKKYHCSIDKEWWNGNIYFE